MKIVSLTEEYVPQAAALEAKSFSTPWSENSIREELQNPWAIWLAAIEGTSLIGYLGCQYTMDGADILTLAVESSCRRRGIAEKLILSMVEILKVKNLEWLTLEVRPSNSPARKLYKKLGFQQVGQRPRYYQKPTEDAFLLTLFFKEDIKDADYGNRKLL